MNERVLTLVFIGLIVFALWSMGGHLADYLAR